MSEWVLGTTQSPLLDIQSMNKGRYRAAVRATMAKSILPEIRMPLKPITLTQPPEEILSKVHSGPFYELAEVLSFSVENYHRRKF